MPELKLISKHPDSLKQIIQSVLSERLHTAIAIAVGCVNVNVMRLFNVYLL